MGQEELAELRTDMAEQRTEWAEQRTEWADRRTLLANERNFSAWLRTSLSSMGGGLAVARLLGAEEAGFVAYAAGILLILFGATASLIAYWQYHEVSDELEKAGVAVTPSWVAKLMVGGLLVVAAMGLILILYM
jgi:putative membrane protein